MSDLNQAASNKPLISASRKTVNSQKSVVPTGVSSDTGLNTAPSTSIKHVGAMNEEEQDANKSIPFYRRKLLMFAIAVGLLVLVGVLVLVLLLLLTRSPVKVNSQKGPSQESSVASTTLNLKESTASQDSFSTSSQDSFSTSSQASFSTATTTSTAETPPPPVNNSVVTVKDSLETIHMGRVVIHKRNYKNLNIAASVFLGVPYAQQIFAKSRYGKAQKLVADPKEYNRTSFGNFCLQSPSSISNFSISLNDMQISDNCLTLNIFAPYQKKQSSTLYPVYVHFHGGSLTRGSSAELGNAVINTLVAQGIVVVTPNYRLGPSGFLDAPENSNGTWKHSKDRGLLDQITALEWVYSNINAFGGNNSLITIGGQGSGACTAEFIAMSESEKLASFKRVILLSGTIGMCSQNAFGRKEQSSGQKFIEKRCHEVDWNAWVSGGNDQFYAPKVEKCLQELNSTDTSKLAEDINEWELSDDSIYQKVPNSTVKKVEVLMGVSNHAFYSYDLQLRKNSDFFFVEDKNCVGMNCTSGRRYVENVLERICKDWKPTRFDALLDQIIKLYKFDGNQIDKNQWLSFYLKAMTDGLIATKIYHRAKMLSDGGHSVHMYRFIDDNSIEMLSVPPLGDESDLLFEAESSYLFLPRQVWKNFYDDEKYVEASQELAKQLAEFIREGQLDNIKEEKTAPAYLKIFKDEFSKENSFLEAKKQEFWETVKSSAGFDTALDL